MCTRLPSRLSVLLYLLRDACCYLFSQLNVSSEPKYTNHGTKYIQESLWSRDLWSVVSNTAADIIFLYMNSFKGIVWIVIDSNFKLSSHLKHKHVIHNQSKINEYKQKNKNKYNLNKLMAKFTCLWMIWIIIWWWKCTQTFKCTRSTCFPCVVNSVMLIVPGKYMLSFVNYL